LEGILMTTESIVTQSPARARPARSVLAGIAAFGALGAYVLVSSVGLGLWTSLGPGPGLFPFAMGAVLAAMSVLWLVQELKRPSTTGEGADGGLVLAVVVSLVLLAALLDLLGFQLSMFLFLMYHLKIRGKRSWPSALLTALAGSVGAFYAFNYGLNVALPVASIPVLNLIGL
jgi:putative tricarboxylic transport membrane protein